MECLRQGGVVGNGGRTCIHSQQAPSTAPSRWTSQRRRRRDVARRALFDPPPFRPEKLTVTYHEELVSNGQGTGPPAWATQQQQPGVTSRRYTLTHNDITGALKLTVGSEYNHRQISGFYTKLLRDEVVAEWVFQPRPCLHVYCHVSGEERWLAPPLLRNYIFRRELPLVLETFLYADRHLLAQRPELREAEVYVHFQSTQQELNTIERWGILGQRSTWQPVPTSMLKRLLVAVTGLPLDLPPPEEQQQQHLLQLVPPMGLAQHRTQQALAPAQHPQEQQKQVAPETQQQQQPMHQPRLLLPVAGGKSQQVRSQARDVAAEEQQPLVIPSALTLRQQQEEAVAEEQQQQQQKEWLVTVPVPVALPVAGYAKGSRYGAGAAGLAPVVAALDAVEASDAERRGRLEVSQVAGSGTMLPLTAIDSGKGSSLRRWSSRKGMLARGR